MQYKSPNRLYPVKLNKKVMKILTTLFLAILLTNTLSFSQSNYGVGIFLGMSSHGSDANSWGNDGQSIFDNSKLAFGINLKYSLDSQVGLSLDYKRTNIEGNDMNLAGKDISGAQHVARAYAYKSCINEIAVILDYELFKKPAESIKHFTPYVFGGIGVSFLNDDEENRDWGNVPDGKEGSAAVDQLNGSSGGVQIPLGAGLKFDLSEKINISVFYSARLALGIILTELVKQPILIRMMLTSFVELI